MYREWNVFGRLRQALVHIQTTNALGRHPRPSLSYSQPFRPGREIEASHETGRPNQSHETKYSGVNGNKEMFPCSAAHEQDWQAYPQLPPVIGAPQVCCGHVSGISFPRLLWFGGCSTHVTQCSVPGYSYFTMCSEKSEHNCLTSYWYTAALLARFFLFACLRRCFSLNLSSRNKKKNGNQQKTRLEASKPSTAFKEKSEHT